MSGSDAIVVGEGFLSEHYFTTDARNQSFLAEVLKRRTAWDDEKQSPRSRFTEARARLEATLAGLGENPDELGDTYDRLRELLGYTSSGLHSHAEGPLTRYCTPGLNAAPPLVLVEALPVASVEELLAKDAETLTTAVELGDQAYASTARLLSALFVAEDAPSFALVLAGRWALVAERERWAEGRYLAVDLQLVCERNDTKKGGEIDRALTCLAADSLAPDADGDIWWSRVLEESVKHTVGVSQDLREGVRLSIEIIGNEVVRRRSAAGLAPLPDDQAQPLAIQSLRFLYRILFLLYAEASPELGVLPVGAAEYQNGYSLDRLRDLALVQLTTPSAQQGRHLYESLHLLYRLVDQGPPRPPLATAGPVATEGLDFRSLRADLFSPAATALIDEVGLGNAAMQQVLGHLLLSKEKRGKDRGFISYAELGINQLGAVYEGLMSYTGSFAPEDLYEVAKAGDPSKGSWVVPVTRAQGISEKDFVRVTDEATGEHRPVIHHRGTFVFRLSGRARQQSASYYTPEVLTRFTVGQALEELLDQDGTTTTAREILDLTICEPALGSGAFAIEAVRQLAEQYLKRRQAELNRTIDPEEYPRRLQEVKAYLALHQVYGVDLNSTAVELAEISLWLDTMVDGLAAPWFGLHLRRGNSLIGARRALFDAKQVKDKTWLKGMPVDAPLKSAPEAEAVEVAGTVHHFLLPAEGWGAAINAKEAKELAPEALVRLKEWRTSVLVKPNATQVKQLVDLGLRVEQLWQLALARLEVAEREIRRSIPVWGTDDLPHGGAVTREEVEAYFADAQGAFSRLKRVMDAWCALWFWPLTDTLTVTVDDEGLRHRVEPPTLERWIDALQQLLGRHDGKKAAAAGQERLGAGTTWAELETAESLDLGLASAMRPETVERDHPWLQVCDRIAEQQGFFHWELQFAPVFARGGGFDLQVGNPPWVRPRSDVDALLAEGDPWWQLALKPSEAERKLKRDATLELPGVRDLVLDGTAEVAVTAQFVGDEQHYPHLTGLQPDLYRCFMEQTWRHTSRRGMIGLIHLESHFTDEKAGPLRAATYRRLRRHWQFINELKLFEIQDQKRYGVNVYGADRAAVSFANAASIYHPDTVLRSLRHDGFGPEPGIKDLNDQWDVRPHAGRIVTVTEDTLRSWHAVLESDDVPVLQTRMVYAVNASTAAVLAKLSRSARLGELDLQFSSGWHEKNDRTKGYFASSWGAPVLWSDVILQGPHLFVATPMYKSPNETMLHHLDWTATDFEALAPDAVPVTSYKPAGDRAAYDAKYTHWTLPNGEQTPARDHYRIAWRRMAANTGERTLISAIIPPGSAHVHPVSSIGLPGGEMRDLAVVAGYLASLLADFSVRSAPKSEVLPGTVGRMPAVMHHPLRNELTHRVLKLNCIVRVFAEFWHDSWDYSFGDDSWTGGLLHSRCKSLGDGVQVWREETPLRVAADRRQALVEIDALVALMLGVTADELCTIYRTQFPVLYGYDRNRDHYDANGRLVPHSVLSVWRKKGDAITLEERTAKNQAGNTYVYDLPFVTLDREHDMRVAYAEFERRLAEREGRTA